MKLKNLKIGDKITHFCSGKLVHGTVTMKGKMFVLTEHEAVNWGNDVYTNTSITESSHLQKKWGGNSENGLPSKVSYTTPRSWYKGIQITV